jgi:hypothetical protein
VSPQRPSGRRFAAFVAALSALALAFGALALPRLAADGVPAALQAPATAQTVVEQKREDRRCERDHRFQHDRDVFERAADAPT